ncbi:DUF4145 domain-containing protein [Paenibacillus sp. FSL W8-0194]|uniref:DUF4145 domain-containing protein n=1 Tax=Paenibacillus sp. FSL W8-0194 TaxID=2921711 RepID=UPI0030D78DF6
MSSIFTFLGEVNEPLAALVIQAEADMWSNPRATLTQGRLFSEEMAVTVSKMEKVEPVYAIKPNERMHLLVRRGVVSEEIKESFEWLRRNGNIAAHDVKPIPMDLALTAHRHLFTLAQWFVESYGPLDISTPVYSMPMIPSERESEGSELNSSVSDQLEQLLSAQLEAKILPALTEQFKQLQDTITQVTVANAIDSQRNTHDPSMGSKEGNSEIDISLSGANKITDYRPDRRSIEVREYLEEKGMTIVDKRKNGGAMWIVGGWELKEELLALKEQKIYFKFAKNGSQSTKRKPAWFMMGKDPTELRWITLENESLSLIESAQNEVPTNLPMAVNALTDLGNSETEMSKSDLLESTDDQMIIEPTVQPTVTTEESRLGTVIRKSFLNKELVFPQSMADMKLDDININGCGALLAYLKEKCRATTIQEIPEDLPNLANQINGVGPKGIERFVKQLEEAITAEKKLIGSGKRKEQAVVAYRRLKKRLGRRPSYMEIYQQGGINSQEYRLLFNSYYNFLLEAKELDKTESAVAKRYAGWLVEIENTIIRKSYKMVLLLAMLDRGILDWKRPITPEEAAPFFYEYYMSNPKRKETDFSDNETRKLWDAPLERTAQLIARMPMTHLAKSAKKLVRYTEEGFSIGFQIRESDNPTLYEWTREICEYRLIEYFERKA